MLDLRMPAWSRAQFIALMGYHLAFSPYKAREQRVRDTTKKAATALLDSLKELPQTEIASMSQRNLLVEALMSGETTLFVLRGCPHDGKGWGKTKPAFVSEWFCAAVHHLQGEELWRRDGWYDAEGGVFHVLEVMPDGKGSLSGHALHPHTDSASAIIPYKRVILYCEAPSGPEDGGETFFIDAVTVDGLLSDTTRNVLEQPFGFSDIGGGNNDLETTFMRPVMERDVAGALKLIRLQARPGALKPQSFAHHAAIAELKQVLAEASREWVRWDEAGMLVCGDNHLNLHGRNALRPGRVLVKSYSGQSAPQ